MIANKAVGPSADFAGAGSWPARAAYAGLAGNVDVDMLTVGVGVQVLRDLCHTLNARGRPTLAAQNLRLPLLLPRLGLRGITEPITAIGSGFDIVDIEATQGRIAEPLGLTVDVAMLTSGRRCSGPWTTQWVPRLITRRLWEPRSRIPCGRSR